MDRSRKNCSGYFSAAAISAVIICFLIMNDTGNIAAIRHLAAVFSVSFFMRPFMTMRQLKIPDGGFAISFGLGLIICFFPAWTISALGLCDYSTPVIFISFILLGMLGFAIKKYILVETYITGDEFRRFAGGFAVFAVIFLAYFWMIGFNPVVDAGTENYMDYGFIQTIYRQKAAIPQDIWFSGEKLNYYYLGQSACVYLLRLGGNIPEYGYNILLATFIGMVFLMVFELVTGLAKALLPASSKKEFSSAAGGVIGAVVAAFGANPHWVIYGIIRPLISKISGKTPDTGYWFPDGTVYIRTDVGDPDNGKNEFPAYSVILGDLHAHVINLMFVLPLIAILFDHCLTKEEERGKLRPLYKLVLMGVLLGYYKGSNYWDFAIYYVITGAVIVFCDLKRSGVTPRAFGSIIMKALLVTGVSFLVPLPFTMNFIKMESGIVLCDTHTPIHKLIVLWLIPVVVTLSFVAYMYVKKREEGGFDKTCRAGLLAFSLCTVGLVLVPEVIYVKDIYGGDNNRFNTMFKLTYEAYTLFAVIFGVAFALWLNDTILKIGRYRLTCALIAAMSLYAILSASYTGYAAHQWLGDVWDPAKRTGISSLEKLREDPVYGFEMEAYDVLESDDRRVINIVEAAGDSYTHNDALSVYSGACTPVGWFVHEWMWHNDPEPVRERADYVNYFYTSGNSRYCRNFIKLYDIDYIFVGPAEVCRYPVNTDGFEDLGEICISTTWQGAQLSLIKVDRSKL